MDLNTLVGDLMEAARAVDEEQLLADPMLAAQAPGAGTALEGAWVAMEAGGCDPEHVAKHIDGLMWKLFHEPCKFAYLFGRGAGADAKSQMKQAMKSLVQRIITDSGQKARVGMIYAADPASFEAMVERVKVHGTSASWGKLLQQAKAEADHQRRVEERLAQIEGAQASVRLTGKAPASFEPDPDVEALLRGRMTGPAGYERKVYDATPHNVSHILSMDPRVRDNVRLNVLDGLVYVRSPYVQPEQGPSHPVTGMPYGFRPLDDGMTTKFCHWMALTYTVDVVENRLDHDLRAHAQRHTYNPLWEYLMDCQHAFFEAKGVPADRSRADGLVPGTDAQMARRRALDPYRTDPSKPLPKWDPDAPAPGARGLFTRFFKVERSELAEAYALRFLISAVAMAYRTECPDLPIIDAYGRDPRKVDVTPILKGRQGDRKSQTIAALVPHPFQQRAAGALQPFEPHRTPGAVPDHARVRPA